MMRQLLLLQMVEKYHANYFIGKTYFSITFVECWMHIMPDTCFQVL